MQWTKTVLNTQYNKCFNNLHSGGSNGKEWIHNFKFLLWDNQMRTEWFHWKESLWAGIEPARGNPIGFRVQRLNLSAITAAINSTQWEILKRSLRTSVENIKVLKRRIKHQFNHLHRGVSTWNHKFIIILYFLDLYKWQFFDWFRVNSCEQD